MYRYVNKFTNGFRNYFKVIMKFSEIAMQQVRERRFLIEQADSWLYEEITPYLGQRVLEIGCGLGNFTRRLTDRELYIGIDISEESVQYINEVYESFQNIHAYVADITNPTVIDLDHFNFDTVISLNVFEHIENDIVALQNVCRLLQYGTVVLVVPAHDWLYGTMDTSIGHYRRYTKKKMVNLLAQANLNCVKQKYINFLGAIGWFVNGRIFRQKVPPTGQLKLINRILPLLKSVERCMDIPFGVSLLTVARNTSNLSL